MLADASGGVDGMVAAVHIKMAEIAETAAEQSDAQVVFNYGVASIAFVASSDWLWQVFVFTSHFCVQSLRETAARFKQPFRKELESVPSRRVLFEGPLTKVCSNGRGKQKRYQVCRCRRAIVALFRPAHQLWCAFPLQFFLFTDLLVYASTGAFSSMYTMHGCINLESVNVSLLFPARCLNCVQFALFAVATVC
jgi:hypothetical protein